MLDQRRSTVLELFSRCRDAFQRDLGAHNERKSQFIKTTDRLKTLGYEREVDELAMQLLEAITTRGQDVIREQIDSPVSVALQTVYQDKSLSFVTEMVRTGDRMEVDFRFKDGDSEITGPILDSVGGGLIDIASFTLRLCLFRLSGCTGPMILDEPFRHVDSVALPRAAEFANRVSLDMGIQLIVVTHSDAIADLAKTKFTLTSKGVVK